ncbi:diacylglycerol kinase [Alicyclobacillus fastidiosus]|uniref:Diacylglycerol kinase n=1 Tax=Alicyclobacillus fastidiosus TaxID=392011 RepID=A0ABV5ACF5_9BACL|nr:diacylglycerol kinase [Alicyclobacillus fastidiosus]WEH11347.1 diacylglycerol kinase [Alicyclobacillus fastidiosus]
MRDTSEYKASSFRKSLTFAFHGMVYAFHSETNMRRHFWLFNTLAAVELVFRPPLTEVAVSLFVATCIFSAELLNTAIELAVDLSVEWKHHPIAGAAKDVAAGAVSMLAFGSLFVGIWVIAMSVPLRFRLFSTVHPCAAWLLIIATAAIWTVRYWPFHRVPMNHVPEKETQDGV